MTEAASAIAGAEIQTGLVNELGKAMAEVPVKAFHGVKAAAERAAQQAAEVERFAKNVELTAVRNASWALAQAREAEDTARQWRKVAKEASEQAVRATGARKFAVAQHAFTRARQRAIDQAPAELASAAQLAQAQAMASWSGRMWGAAAPSWGPGAYSAGAGWGGSAGPSGGSSGSGYGGDYGGSGSPWGGALPGTQPVGEAPLQGDTWAQSTQALSFSPPNQPVPPPPTLPPASADLDTHYLAEAAVHPRRRNVQSGSWQPPQAAARGEWEGAEPGGAPGPAPVGGNAGGGHGLRAAELSHGIDEADAQLQEIRAARGLSALQLQPGSTKPAADAPSSRALRGAPS